MNIKPEVEILFSQYIERDAIDQSFKDFLLRGSEVPKTEKGKKILFVGINPSDDGKQSNPERYIISNAVRDYPRYFGVFQTLSEKIGIAAEDWTYIDLFFHRKTDQLDIDRVLVKKHGVDFLCDQLRLSQLVLEWARPELIVVCNARAADFFGVNTTDKGSNVWMGYEFKFDESCGLHRINGLHSERINKELTVTQLKNIPVCFTSTLKYMDRFSKDRLAWQLRFALDSN
jgi:hypothetical protein